MIPKSGNRFSEKIMLHGRLERVHTQSPIPQLPEAL
jgi:hypothetical protein